MTPVDDEGRVPPAVSGVRADYLRIQQRICKVLEVDMDTVGSEDGPEAKLAQRAFAHLAHLWSDPSGEPEGVYDATVHALVWSCAVDAYILEGLPTKGVPVRMRAIEAIVRQFLR